MRVLFLNQFYRPDPAATGQYLADVAHAMVARGHDVHVICTRRPYKGGAAAHLSEDVLDGVHVHRVDATGFGRRRIFGRGMDYLSFYLLAWRRAMLLPPMDACVALTTPPLVAMLAGTLARRRGTVGIHWVMDMYPEILAAFRLLKPQSLAYRILAWASRRIYRNAARIVALGDVMARNIRDAIGCEDRIVTIDNWVPADAVHPIAPERSALRRQWATRGEVTVMYSGNLGVGHDLEPLVRAAGHLASEHPLRLLFVGHGQTRPALKALARELGLACVDFHSPRPLSELADSLAAGDIHIVSQRDRTQGLLLPSKIYGVLAAGRPVVFIGPEDTEIARMLRRSGAGFVVPPGDTDATTEALKTLLADETLRHDMGARGRAWHEQYLGMERSIEKWVSVIETAVAETAGSTISDQTSPT